jgi:hypothetical protein
MVALLFQNEDFRELYSFCFAATLFIFNLKIWNQLKLMFWDYNEIELLQIFKHLKYVLRSRNKINAMFPQSFMDLFLRCLLSQWKCWQILLWCNPTPREMRKQNQLRIFPQPLIMVFAAAAFLIALQIARPFDDESLWRAHTQKAKRPTDSDLMMVSGKVCVTNH